MNNNFPLILIGSPTSANKAYCDDLWVKNALETDYPKDRYKVVLYDNTQDNGEYCASLNDRYKSDNFECIRSNTKFCRGLKSLLAKGHNDIRDYAIKHEYDFLLHLESDVFPEPNFLQELLFHDKPVVGAIYHRDEGKGRRLMIQKQVFAGPGNVLMQNFDPEDAVYFIDGTLKSVGHAGLGCVLIRKDVLEKIPFRYEEKIHAYPDSFWSEDLYRRGIKYFVDTKLICTHLNSNWHTDLYAKGLEA